MVSTVRPSFAITRQWTRAVSPAVWAISNAMDELFDLFIRFRVHTMSFLSLHLFADLIMRRRGVERLKTSTSLWARFERGCCCGGCGRCGFLGLSPAVVAFSSQFITLGLPIIWSGVFRWSWGLSSTECWAFDDEACVFCSIYSCLECEDASLLCPKMRLISLVTNNVLHFSTNNTYTRLLPSLGLISPGYVWVLLGLSASLELGLWASFNGLILQEPISPRNRSGQVQILFTEILQNSISWWATMMVLWLKFRRSWWWHNTKNKNMYYPITTTKIAKLQLGF